MFAFDISKFQFNSFEKKQAKELKKIVEKNGKVEIKQFKDFIKENPVPLIDELAYLEAAKLLFLQREYKKADECLIKVKSDKIIETDYWKAKILLKLGKYTQAILSAQSFIKNSADEELIEISNFVIVESYLKLKKFRKALNTLIYLRKSPYINNNIALMHFKFGLCYEKLNCIDKTIKYYRKVMVDFPYSRYAIFAEKRLYNLKTDNKGVDITDFSTADNSQENAAESNNIYIKAKTGYYVQTGLFSSRKNAANFNDRLNNKGLNSFVFEKSKQGKTYYCVGFGPYDKYTETKKISSKLKKYGFEYYIFER